MPTIAPAPPTGAINRHLVDPELWDRLSTRIANKHEKSSEESEQILDATVGFLKLCADHPERRFAPSELVDIGWHEALMYTRGYAALCDSLGGRFIHHEPNDVPGQPMEAGGNSYTIAFMREHGIAFDPVMWGLCATDCDGGCGPGTGSPNCTCS